MMRLVKKFTVMLALCMSVQAVGSINTTVSKFTTPVIAAASQAQSIESSKMRVIVDDKFPRVLQYEWLANNAVMYGQEDALNEVKINGTSYTPSVTFSNMGSKASYTLSIPSIEVTVSIDLEVVENVLNYNVTEIKDSGTTKVSRFEIPNHNLLSVRSTQTGAAFAGSRMYNAVTGSGDTFMNATGTPAVDSSPGNYMYTILNTNQLAGAVWTNAVQDYSSDNDNDRLHKQTVNITDYYRTGVWSAPWVYRPEGMSTTEPLPSEKVVITPDVNGDGGVDWQDGAVAYRSISKSPFGSEKVPDLVVQRIPFNFASQATNPFLKTLDETKRIYLETDGLQQFIELKGYQQEGHDSAHADYGNNIGIRQGGDADINTLVNEGHKYGGYFGVHISATGANPQAKYFNENLVDPKKPGWDWLDLSFDYNRAQMRSEAATGARLNRLQELKDRVPNLDFIYNDAWFEQGWNGRRLAQEQNSLGWATTTEFPYVLEDDAIWNHWAVDYNYGGQDIKGFNSQIARFIHNHQKDTWIARDPLLGGTELESYEGWQGKVNYDGMIKMTFTTNLPTKYMQHFPILKWTTNTIDFTDNVSVSNTTGTRVIKKDGIMILNGGSYLLPWSPDTEDKLYHWNADGGYTTWTLPVSWSGLHTVKIYKLTDQGKQFIEDLTVTGNQVAINALANTPYVIYKGDATATPDVNFGQGMPLKDPGFNNGGLSSWTVTGDTQTASVKRNARGQYELKIASGESVSVSQQLTVLSPGTYSAYVYVQVDGKRRARIGVKDYGGAEVSNYTDSSFAINYIAGDSKHDTNMQRMRVLFDVPVGQTTATLYLQGEIGASNITFDDVHLMKVQRAANPTGAYFAEDFEHVDAGLYPFVKGDAGGSNDPRTSLANLHAPYTQKGWNGNPIDHVISGDWSLMSHKENMGLIYRTLPQTLRFAPGTNYTISFKYENQKAGDYALVIGDGTREISSVNFDTVTSPQTFTKVIAGSPSGNTWVGIRKLTSNDSDFTMDDFTAQVGGEIPPASVPQSQMTVTATSQEMAGSTNPASNVLDGQSGTIWHTKWDSSNSLPQSITLNLGGTYNVTNLKYLPRQAGGVNGIITAYNVYVSDDGTNFTKVATGSWANDATEKNASFASTSASYVKLEATAGNGGYASAAEINVNYEEPVIIPQAQMTATATSQETANENSSASNVLDETSSTIWHTKWDSNTLPQSITLNLGGSYQVSQLNYLPRQDGNVNGIITSYNIYTSTDGVNFTKAATGTWVQSSAQKSVAFKPVTATHVKLEAVQGVNNFASAAEINVFSVPVATVPVTGVQLDKPQVSLKEGQTAELVATVLPENAKNKNVTWMSSDDTVATVEVKDGKTVVTALKEGVADITVTTVGGNFTAVSKITVQKGDGTPNAASTTLSAAGTVQTGEEFPVQLGLVGVTQSVYAQDIKMDYDTNVLEFVSAHAVKDGIDLVETAKDTLGKLRFIIASLGKAVSGDVGILELKFKAKAMIESVTGKIAVTDATLGDEHGVEMKVQASEVNVIIATPPLGVPGDLNNDKRVSVGDLSIVAVNYGKNKASLSSSDWEKIKLADVTGDGKIEIEDLVFVATKMME
jgi:endo-alpha-N-acetylgalactosaminidase